MLLIIDAREFKITPNPDYDNNKLHSNGNVEKLFKGVVRAITPTDRYDTYAEDMKTSGTMCVRVAHSLKKAVKWRFPGPKNEAVCDEVTSFIIQSMIHFDVLKRSVQIGITIDIDTKLNDLLLDSFEIWDMVFTTRKTLDN